MSLGYQIYSTAVETFLKYIVIGTLSGLISGFDSLRNTFYRRLNIYGDFAINRYPYCRKYSLGQLSVSPLICEAWKYNLEKAVNSDELHEISASQQHRCGDMGLTMKSLIVGVSWLWHDGRCDVYCDDNMRPPIKWMFNFEYALFSATFCFIINLKQNMIKTFYQNNYLQNSSRKWGNLHNKYSLMHSSSVLWID